MDKDWRDRMQEVATRKMISAAEIARKTKMSTATISRILSKQRSTKLENIKLIAEALAVTTEYLLHGIEQQSNVVTTFRVPILKEDEITQWIKEPEALDQSKMQWINCCVEDCSPSIFAIKVIDRDMIDPTGEESFPPGTIVFVDAELNPFTDGDNVAIGLLAVMQLEDGTIIFRELQRATGRWYGVPKNPQFESIPIDREKTKFIGTVLAQYQQYIKHS